jgi:hypothetical protein
VKTVGKRSMKLSVQEEELCGLQGCKMCVFEQRPFLELADILGCA